MSIDLAFPRGGLTFRRVVWSFILGVALEHGSEPMGTERPQEFEGEWNGKDYGSNSSQYVKDEDARGLAVALEEAIGSGIMDPDGGEIDDELLQMIKILIGFCKFSGFSIY